MVKYLREVRMEMHGVLFLGNVDNVVSLIKYDDAMQKFWLELQIAEQQWVQQVLVAHNDEFGMLAELRLDGVWTETLDGGHTFDHASG